MKISWKVSFGLVLCFLFGIVAGGIGGWHMGTLYLLNEWVLEQAGDVEGHVEALQNLNTRNVNETIEFLESRLDDDLIVLEPQGYQLKQHVRAKMYKSLLAAKQYRMEHPHKSKRSFIDKMVRNVLTQDIPADIK